MTESVAHLLEDLGSEKLTPEELVTFAPFASRKDRGLPAGADPVMRNLIEALKNHKMVEAIEYKEVYKDI